MSTRGLYGIRKNGEDKITYNHSDSYPDSLGRDILEFCGLHSVQDMGELFDLIVLVDTQIPPTEEQIQICQEYHFVDLTVGSQNVQDWYCLVRNLQGDISAWNQALHKNIKIFMTDDSDFITDSLFCEYVYIINLDTLKLEFYEGYQQIPQIQNRYGTEPNCEGYYPCRLMLQIPLNDIRDNVENWIQMMENSIE